MDENSVLDPAVLGLVGVLMGSALSLVGNIISQYLSSRKEAQQWAREQSAKRDERSLDREIKETEELRNLYHQCINCLSVYLSFRRMDSESEQVDMPALMKEIHHWLSKLAVERPDDNLLEALDQFLLRPDGYRADELRSYVLEMVRNDARQRESSDPKESPKAEEIHARAITFKIDREFQRSLMIQGIELPDRYMLPYRPEDLQPEHRRRLLDIYFRLSRRIPEMASLMLPTHRAKATAVTFDEIWEAKVNPLEVGVNGVLIAWAVDFDRRLKEAQSALAEVA